MRPGRSRRAVRSQVVRVSRRRPLPSAPSTRTTRPATGAVPKPFEDHPAIHGRYPRAEVGYDERDPPRSRGAYRELDRGVGRREADRIADQDTEHLDRALEVSGDRARRRLGRHPDRPPPGPVGVEGARDDRGGFEWFEVHVQVAGVEVAHRDDVFDLVRHVDHSAVDDVEQVDRLVPRNVVETLDQEGGGAADGRQG